MKKFLKIVLLMLLEITPSEQDEVSTDALEGSNRVLSRRKRFLIFPDGSSFQFVFCTQSHGYLRVGDIIWFGSTAAISWELPSDPKLFQFFKKHDKFYTAENRNGISKLIYFLDENGKVLGKKPYKKKPLVNPAFAKRSLDGSGDFEEELRSMSNKEMHKRRKDIKIFDSLDRDEIEFHREGRKDLYGQLEVYIQALGWRGRECVLRLLCETGKGADQKQSTFIEEILKATFTLGSDGRSCLLKTLCLIGQTQNSSQGAFVEEIIRAVFTLPKGNEIDDVDEEYDAAFSATQSCEKLYPNCNENVESPFNAF